MIFLFLAVVAIGFCWALKVLVPEMAKPPVYTIRKLYPDSDLNKLTQSAEPDPGIGKLETLLVEKNKNIGLLERELKILHTQEQSFNKVKTLLEEEIQRLREQNRMFRSELGLPTVPSKENSIT
jgi:hypothetical protein